MDDLAERSRPDQGPERSYRSTSSDFEKLLGPIRSRAARGVTGPPLTWRQLDSDGFDLDRFEALIFKARPRERARSDPPAAARHHHVPGSAGPGQGPDPARRGLVARCPCGEKEGHVVSAFRRAIDDDVSTQTPPPPPPGPRPGSDEARQGVAEAPETSPSGLLADRSVCGCGAIGLLSRGEDRNRSKIQQRNRLRAGSCSIGESISSGDNDAERGGQVFARADGVVAAVAKDAPRSQ